jgi:ferric-dicitrate binding protein FerR (iron transport regulator)
MPPEREDARARQIEALRRYFAQLGQRDRPTVEAAEAQPASERRRRPSRPWLLLTGLLVVVALVGGVLVGAVAWSDDRPPGGTGSAAVVRDPASPCHRWRAGLGGV